MVIRSEGTSLLHSSTVIAPNHTAFPVSLASSQGYFKRVTGFEFYPTFIRTGRTILIRPLRSSGFTLLSTFPCVRQWLARENLRLMDFFVSVMKSCKSPEISPIPMSARVVCPMMTPMMMIVFIALLLGVTPILLQIPCQTVKSL